MKTAASLILAFGALSGCAGVGTVPDGHLTPLSSVTLRADERVPETNLRLFAKSHSEGAAKGAVAGFLAGGGITAGLTAAGPIGAVVGPYLAFALTGTGTAIGAGAGAASVPSTSVETMERAMDEALRRMAPSQAVMTRTSEALVAERRVRVLSEGADAILTLRVVELGFEDGHRKRDTLALYVVAEATVERADGTPPAVRRLAYRGKEREAVQWIGPVAEQELARAYGEFAERLSAELSWTIHPLMDAEHCGLRPIQPPPVFKPSLNPDTWNEFPVVDSLHPHLAWGALADHVPAARDVVYDVRLWRAAQDAPPVLVYQRRDLPVSEHRVETRLAASTDYYWSVRARWDNKTTGWSSFRRPYLEPGSFGVIRPRSGIDALALVWNSCAVDFIPEPNYFRLRTFCQKQKGE